MHCLGKSSRDRIFDTLYSGYRPIEMINRFEENQLSPYRYSKGFHCKGKLDALRRKRLRSSQLVAQTDRSLFDEKHEQDTDETICGTQKHLYCQRVNYAEKPGNPPVNLYTCEYYPKFGGIATYCHELAEAAGRAGQKTTLHAPKSSISMPDVSPRYEIEFGDWAPNHNPLAICYLHRYLKEAFRLRPGVQILPEPGPILALGTMPSLPSLRAHNRIIVVVHGSELIRWSRSHITRHFANRAFEVADKIACVSTPMAEFARRKFPRFQNKIVVIPNALSDALLQKKKGIFPEKNKQESFKLLSVGRFHPRKGFEYILEAIGQLPVVEKSNIEYTIIGGHKSPDYLNRLEARAKELDICLTCKVNASSIELSQAYENADAFALTAVEKKSGIEGFGLVYLEAGAYGLPCLAFNNGGVCDAVRDDITGFICQPGDTAELTSKLRVWMKSPDTRRAMGQANHDFAMSRTWDQVFEEIQTK